MLLIDCDRQADLAKTMYARGQWDDALTLSQKALDGETGARSTTVLDTAAKSALATDHFEIAIKLFERLVQQSSGQPAAREALLHLGLLHYRHGEYAVASAEFERLLTFSQINNFELIARYWQWRSLQKLNSNQADLVADGLMHKAPFSYYGLRARIDRSGGVLEWKEPTAKLTVKEWLTESEKATWDRVQSLLKAGWLDEAQAEIKLLPRPEKVEEKALRALLWAASGQYVNAAKLANEAWDENPELRRSPFVNAVFPLEFSNAIATQAKNRNLDSYMLKGLIKQESGYNVKAISSSNAYGLMQIIPPTAREIAQDLHLGTLQLPDDMFEPTRNILMGTYYIGKLLNKYQGQVPLALAAYNAGPARMDRWIKSRPTLKDLSASRSSQADAELWIDEIPYWETSNYVKSILRNILIYRMLDQGRVEVTEPMWLSSTAR
jgi:soluble lytic murein transglycosylase